MLTWQGNVAQSEAGKRLKIATVWVQIPPFLLRGVAQLD